MDIQKYKQDLKSNNRGLVSILTPAHNTSKYLPSLLESVLRQTYPFIEMFVIDDGSTDNTKEIVSSFVDKFQQRGYTLSYIFQTNSGQSVAINNGLKLVNGEYLVWPDSDDYYASDVAIERMVQIMKSDNSIGMVRTQERLIEDREDGRIVELGIHGLTAKTRVPRKQLFEDCLFCKNGFFFCSGAYMMRLPMFWKANRNLDIYTDKDAGQNWQLMLPMLYHYQCHTILEPLYNVRVRLASHSRGQYQGYDAILKKNTSYCNTIISTLNHFDIPDEERARYSNHINIKYNRIKFELDCRYNKTTNGKKHYHLLKDAKACRFSDKILYISLNMNISKYMLGIIRFTKTMIFKLNRFIIIG